jgi:rRNA maturation RNase YbeY
VSIYNEQEALKNIDEAELRNTVQRISSILGYETYDVTLLLVDDEEMRETNLESRGIDSPTDILSFPFHECQDNQAGLLEEPEFDVPDYYTLGDMVICVPYVIRRCKEDLLLRKELEIVGSGSSFESEQEGAVNNSHTANEDEDVLVEDDDDRGVSGAMAWVDDPEKRIRMLLVHGMLHLVGYDHIEDDDYIEMVEREEELLKELGEL